MHNKILIIDDEINILKSLDIILSSEGYHVFKARSINEARKILKDEHILLFLVDVILGNDDGIGFISEIRQQVPDAIIIMISGNASIKMAVNATQKGADDFFEKPLTKEKLLITLNNFVKRLQIQEKYASLESQMLSGNLIGQSQAVKGIHKQIEKIAPTSSRVLITGKSGTGKEIVARLIHLNSVRRKEPYIKINCAAIPGELIEAELFGSEKGAYTGANVRRDGKFLLADKGTLLLDEIGDMSLDTQTKVLRVLQEGEFERVGGSETIKTDVRIIAATNKDLQSSVKQGTFREDLYFRLHVVPIHIPDLSERKDDVPYLVEYFLHQFCKENNKIKIDIAENVIEKLTEYPWPGNVRELKNLVERLVIMAESDKIELDQLPPEFFNPSFEVSKAFGQQKTLREVRDQIESEYIRYCMDKVNGNVSKLSEILEIDRTYLYKKLKNMGLRD